MTADIRHLWIFFPILFLIVISSLGTVVVRIARRRGAKREFLYTGTALFLYLFTGISGKIHPYLHMPLSNLAEIMILYNAYYFRKQRDIPSSWMHIIALFAIVTDFSLHLILRPLQTS
jgi:uncharacterized protein YceK